MLATDVVWVSMGQDDADGAAGARRCRPYALDEAAVALAADPDALVVLHCLPAHRGEEISRGRDRRPGSRPSWDQAENRLHAQKALLSWLLRAGSEHDAPGLTAATAPATPDRTLDECASTKPPTRAARRAIVVELLDQHVRSPASPELRATARRAPAIARHPGHAVSRDLDELGAVKARTPPACTAYTLAPEENSPSAGTAVGRRRPPGPAARASWSSRPRPPHPRWCCCARPPGGAHLLGSALDRAGPARGRRHASPATTPILLVVRTWPGRAASTGSPPPVCRAPAGAGTRADHNRKAPPRDRPHRARLLRRAGHLRRHRLDRRRRLAPRSSRSPPTSARAARTSKSSASARSTAAPSRPSSPTPVRAEYADGFCLPALQANALYMGRYPLVSALSRPLIAKAPRGSRPAARRRTPSRTACTGKGNDQVRFEVGIGALAPGAACCIAPVRDSGMTRDKAIAFAGEKGAADRRRARSRPTRSTRTSGAARSRPASSRTPGTPRSRTSTPTRRRPGSADGAGRAGAHVHGRGVPTAIDGRPVTVLQAIDRAQPRAPARRASAGSTWSRTAWSASRAARSTRCPARTTLITAHQELETLTVERDLARFKRGGRAALGRAGLRRAVVQPAQAGAGRVRRQTRRSTSAGEVRLVLSVRRLCDGHRTAQRRDTLRLQPGDLRQRRHLRPDGCAKGFVELWGMPSKIAGAAGPAPASRGDGAPGECAVGRPLRGRTGRARWPGPVVQLVALRPARSRPTTCAGSAAPTPAVLHRGGAARRRRAVARCSTALDAPGTAEVAGGTFGPPLRATRTSTPPSSAACVEKSRARSAASCGPGARSNDQVATDLRLYLRDASLGRSRSRPSTELADGAGRPGRAPHSTPRPPA